MSELVHLDPVEYLVIGHLAVDLTPSGARLGGSSAYAALTALALGLRVGVLTSFSPETDITPIDGILTASIPAKHSTTFENIQTPTGRRQIIHNTATSLDFTRVPQHWHKSAIVHLGPIAQEMPSALPESFTPSLLGLTPQGWMRKWDENGHVYSCEWTNSEAALKQAGAVIISLEDVNEDETQIEFLALNSRVLVVTEGAAGCRLYWHGDQRRFRAPQVKEVDPTGAGDIFAAAFFIRLFTTRDPWEAARFANQLAAISVTRPGLQGIPTPEEIQASMVEVF